jgi:hypothetical protein
MATARKLNQIAVDRHVTERRSSSAAIKMAHAGNVSARGNLLDDIERISRTLATQSGAPANQWRHYAKDAHNLVAFMTRTVYPA